MLIESRRTIGIVDVDDFYKLTPNEFKDLKKGAQLAIYDDLVYSQIKAGMVKPIALIDDVKSQSENITQVLEQFKNDIENDGTQAKHSVDMNRLYDLLLRKGGKK
ncbi:hypothetical protein M5C72_02780 [Companilactobacillus allii]|uniref:Uncharacterized protein n=1 Tax=Companilactobacillus allii TaxID=1847728 RepID=A0A1P8Q2N9_9LACO|nr:hypothetical protein [Companilactobacillus allii]APX72087.1 hypothetical protein BTM29_05695 [Companilactobacillus allii]USQ69180.1 hypothetical protein M5C72_02780 [Companilactobacillus allii]